MTTLLTTMTGSGYGTGPGQIAWFCHSCMATFVLPAGGGVHRCVSVKA